MVLVSIAVGSGYLFSIGATFFFEAPDLYWEISTLAVFLLFGHWMEIRTVRDASGALRELVRLIPPKTNLVKNDPRDIPKLLNLSRLTMRKMKENLLWVTGYNVLAIPIAAGVLYSWGILFRPEFAALIMAGSSILVVTNALVMRNSKL